MLEAKKVGTDSQNVLEQAKRYLKGTAKTIGSWNGYRVPFLYSSNGEMWARDSASYAGWIASSPWRLGQARPSRRSPSSTGS